MDNLGTEKDTNLKLKLKKIRLGGNLSKDKIIKKTAELALRPEGPHRPPPSSVLDPPPEIDFFDVSDDLEQKKKFFFLVQKNFWTCKIFQKSQKNFFFRKCQETAPQG